MNELIRDFIRDYSRIIDLSIESEKERFIRMLAYGKILISSDEWNLLVDEFKLDKNILTQLSKECTSNFITRIPLKEL